MRECVWSTHLLLFCRYFAVNRGGREGIDDVSVHLFLIVPVSGSTPSVSVCAILLLVYGASGGTGRTIVSVRLKCRKLFPCIFRNRCERILNTRAMLGLQTASLQTRYSIYELLSLKCLCPCIPYILSLFLFPLPVLPSPLSLSACHPNGKLAK